MSEILTVGFNSYWFDLFSLYPLGPTHKFGFISLHLNLGKYRAYKLAESLVKK